MIEKQAAVEYRDVPGFPGYRVGSDGSVWTCWGTNRLRGAKHTIIALMTDSWREMKLGKNGKGYLYAAMCRGGKQSHIRVHRIVLVAFVGPCPDTMEACHGDGNPANNSLSNLRWDTKQSNWSDRRKHGNASTNSQVIR